MELSLQNSYLMFCSRVFLSRAHDSRALFFLTTLTVLHSKSKSLNSNRYASPIRIPISKTSRDVPSLTKLMTAEWLSNRLSDAAFFAELESGHEAGSVLMPCMNLPVPYPPFLDVCRKGPFPVDPTRQEDFSLELFTCHRV